MRATAAAAGIFILLFPPLSANARESVQRRLVRTIQIGAPQDITVEQIRKIAESNETDYTTEMLARSALVVLQQDDAKLISYDELLDGLLTKLVSDGTPFQQIASLPSFRGKETAFTMVYALVMSGQQERAVDILEKHALTGSRYKQAVVLSALRNIGTPRALSVIQEYAEKGQDRNLAEATLADEDYPALGEIHDRWNVIPPAERTHDNLRAIVQSGCDQRSAMAAYWMGYLAPNIDPNKETAELQALEKLARTNSGSCEMMEHVIALKALGLRSAETPQYWKRAAERTENVWERHQIVINGFGRWGRAFAPAALELLKTDSAQYVQWELLNGNLETRQGREYRNYWDIWIPANTLVVQEFDDSQGRPSMEQKELDAMLDWLDAGARPRDPVVLNHMIYHLLGFTDGSDTRRLLTIFDGLPGRNEKWWILQPLRDPSSLPLLKYWSTLPAPRDQQEMLAHTIGNLEGLAGKSAKAVEACCEATEECLLQHVRNAPAASGAAGGAADGDIRSEEEAREWLRRGAEPVGQIKIEYADELKRTATVRRADGTEEHWQYLYDCWQSTDTGDHGRASASAGASR
jgi:hypothetical protein